MEKIRYGNWECKKLFVEIRNRNKIKYANQEQNLVRVKIKEWKSK